MEIRERIIDGAAELFMSYGIRAVTMDSIAQHLGMSKRTIYEVFRDKNDLLIGVLNIMSERQKTLVEKVLNESENSIFAIFKLLEINTVHFQNISPAFQLDIKKFHRDVMTGKSDEGDLPGYKVNMLLIEQGIKENYFRDNINPDVVSRCLFLLIRSIMDQDLFPSAGFTRREVVKNLFVNYLRGISTEKGLELINRLDSEF